MLGDTPGMRRSMEKLWELKSSGGLVLEAQSPSCNLQRDTSAHPYTEWNKLEPEPDDRNTVMQQNVELHAHKLCSCIPVNATAACP